MPDDPSTRDSVHEAAGISTTIEEEDARSGGLLFVLTIYAASRLFYLGAGTMFAGNLPAGGFHWLTPDVPPGTLNIWAHWDGAWYSQIAAEGYYTVASTAFFPLYPLLMRSSPNSSVDRSHFQHFLCGECSSPCSPCPSPSTSSTT